MDAGYGAAGVGAGVNMTVRYLANLIAEKDAQVARLTRERDGAKALLGLRADTITALRAENVRLRSERDDALSDVEWLKASDCPRCEAVDD